ncbi:Auxin-induced protein [Macleaya cordata]|uniref:Auxin-induced protein n=1 Tax=Macleaya cordata TaxID=56857 RepID=A0A200QQT7_MACCD|nr:Auxin-induced protein [Macleaya cordata]
MGIRFPGIIPVKQILHRSLSKGTNDNVTKGHFTVYVGDSQFKKHFVVPISYLSHPEFQQLLSQAEDEFGFDHPMGGLTIPCNEDEFVDLTSRLSV